MKTPYSSSVVTKIQRYLLVVVAVYIYNSASSSCHAQALPLTAPIMVNVRVEAKPEPKKAVGLVLSSGQMLEVADTTIKKIGEKLYSIGFLIDRNVVHRDSVATAMAFDENGVVTFANVTPELLSEAHASTANIPECPAEDASAMIQRDQQGPLRQLVDVRTERAALARVKISRLLDEQFLSKLQRFEDAFGLEKGDVLSADLPPAVLVDRLSRITYALGKYRMFKKAPPTPIPDENS